ncbi:MAG: tripartite tricarboxylate transporter substrate-binding protein, partial [Burkholderiales bacterium]
GVPEGLSSLMGGQIDLMFPPIFNAIPLMNSGRIRVLGVTTNKRSPVLPDMPTIAESGLPGYEQTVWHALLSPSGTPPEIVSKLNEATKKALMSNEVRGKLESLGATAVSSTPEQLAVYMKLEIDKWAKVIKEASVKVD